MNRKQEVIGIIAWEICIRRTHIVEHERPCPLCKTAARETYDRIAPLREFPEEEAIREVNDLIHSIEGYIDGGDTQAVTEAHIYTLILQTFKHLWEGGDHRSGDERREKESQFMKDTKLVYVGYSREFNSPLYTEDRRTLPDRRKAG